VKIRKLVIYQQIRIQEGIEFVDAACCLESLSLADSEEGRAALLTFKFCPFCGRSVEVLEAVESVRLHKD